MWAESAGPGKGSTFSWSIAVKIPQGGRSSTVNTAAKSRRSSVLLSASSSKQRGQQQQQYGGGLGVAGLSGSSDGGGLGDRTLAGVLGLAGFNPGGLCQDSDETCSVVSSDAGTVASGEDMLGWVMFLVGCCSIFSGSAADVWSWKMSMQSLQQQQRQIEHVLSCQE
jgi:hypothetical protein